MTVESRTAQVRIASSRELSRESARQAMTSSMSRMFFCRADRTRLSPSVRIDLVVIRPTTKGSHFHELNVLPQGGGVELAESASVVAAVAKDQRFVRNGSPAFGVVED